MQLLQLSADLNENTRRTGTRGRDGRKEKARYEESKTTTRSRTGLREEINRDGRKKRSNTRK